MFKSFRGAIGAAAVALTVLILVGCSGGGGHVPGDGGAGHAGHDASTARDAHVGVDRPVDAGSSHDASCSSSGTKKATGQACACASDCTSGFCVDGVCCSSACTGGCMTCNASGSEGTCSARPGGASPRTASTCPMSPASSCGLDGTCDGAGKCRDYPTGTICSSGTCQGAALVGIGVCDGAGTCALGPTMICSPFGCDATKSACFDTCTSDSQCDQSTGHVCKAGSCGPKMGGQVCAKASECQSGFCADGVCCNTACSGACVACNLPGPGKGVCWPVGPNERDPHGVCKAATDVCGQNGLCDGVGGCELAPLGTTCVPPFCTGNKLNTAAICDGLGSCKPAGLQNCSPFICYSESCTGACNTDADCDTGIACVNRSCGLKQNGQPCGKASECKSNQCVDGVCCDSACTGACRSCSSPSSLGKCTMLPAGAVDSRAVCKDGGSAACGANGKCDGAGSCQLYAKGTGCKAESCSSNVYTPPSSCDGTGRCVTPDTLACSPYTCNGSKCFSACTMDTQCLTPNRCANNSCGKSGPGASCSSADQCQSGFCAQGVCCNSACGGACQSCALSGSLGTCTNIATGSADTSGMCKDQGAASCGTNGKCQAGACQKYASGTQCAAATCPTGTVTSTGASTCDGAGTCVKPASKSCFPYLCGGTSCKAACSTSADCDPPNTCVSGSCGLKGNGQTCGSASECKSGFCTQGVCCSTNCNGACKSCNVSASTAGTCTNVPVGNSDPQGTCTDQGAASCGTTGVCDGSGACGKYAAGTTCVAPSCPSGKSTQTNARTCDGKGTCQAATTTNCAPYLCNGTTSCNATCTSDSGCVSPTICDPKTNHCGNLQRQGQPCTITNGTSNCLTGLSCVDGVCCASSACGMCQACNVAGSAGTCANLPANSAAPSGQCATSSSNPCGNNGTCDGNGKCSLADTNTPCAAATCNQSTDMYTPPSHCNGAGVCATPASMSCSPFQCGATACRDSCTADSDCLPPNTCQPGVGGTKSCGLKGPGVACTSGSECNSGNCVDNVCCGSSSCPACNACNVDGSGTCQPKANGATDTRCGATSPCGVTNSCEGGKCADSTAMCAGPMCSGSSFTPASMCPGTASTACPSPAPTNCGLYTCTTSGCKTTCSDTASDCAAGAVCSGGHCVSGGGIGDPCGAQPCAAGTCVDGVCCSSASCGLCQSCNVAGKAGTCTFVGDGTPEPHNMCPASPGNVCGNTGTCTSHVCAQASSATMCGAASCTNGTETDAVFCDGHGNCPAAPTKQCDPYLCGPTACAGSCLSFMDCTAGHYCDSSNHCQSKLSPGASCASTDQCATGVCSTAEGVCCDQQCDTTMCKSCTVAGSAGMCITNPSCGSPDGGTGP